MFSFSPFANSQAAAQALALAVADALNAVLTQKSHAVLAVSGGRSPVAFFEALSRMPLHWAQVSIMPVDERLVPANHVDYNGGLIARHLLQHEAAAAQWLPLTGKEGATTPKAALALAPQLTPDIVVLGMGEDGHTASLFANAPQFSHAISNLAAQWVYTAPQDAPHLRIGLSLNALKRCPHLFLAIVGANKHHTFTQAARAADAQLPISLLLHDAGAHVHVFYAE